MIPTLFSCLAVSVALGARDPERFTFERTTIDGNVEIGYGLAIEDVDSDSKPDILLADKRAFVWYRNGEWKRSEFHAALTERDNVCVAARRDGEGVLEIALGGDWGPTDTTRAGCARIGSWSDPKSTFAPNPLAAEPTVHRIRFVALSDSKRLAAVIAPLHGRGNVNGRGDPVRIEAFIPDPHDAKAAPRRELLDASLHKTHNIDVFDFLPAVPGEEVLVIGEGGAKVCSRSDGQWHSETIPGIRDGGEIRAARDPDGKRLIATIEPMHGNVLALYREQSDGTYSRTELDSTLAEGHALAFADLDADGHPEVVAGWRQKDAQGEVGIRAYSTHGEASPVRIDRETACEDLKVVDLDVDGRIDIVAAGRASHDLVILWNRTPKRP